MRRSRYLRHKDDGHKIFEQVVSILDGDTIEVMPTSISKCHGRSECLTMIVWAIVLLLTANTAYGDFWGPVTDVLDGDTIEVLHNTHPERVRLSGIACPEKGQAFDNRAK
jgi:endonuclease YncB( thermonuclease family)